MKKFLPKKSLLAIVLLMGIFNATAQNLVPNPSFESTNGSTFGCPGYGNLNNWVNPDPTDSCSTPDLFSTGCSGIFGILGAPSNGQGNQAPRTGTNYAGFIVDDLPADNYREYIETPLSTPLTAGVSYCVTFYVSLADDSPDGTDRIGVYFSNSLTQFTTNNCNNTAPLPFVPQLQAPVGTPILDKTNWVQLQWMYTATGGENHITIGNFFNKTNTTLTAAGSGSQPFSYYYIDDISITAGACCNNGITPVGPFCSTDPVTTLTAQTTGGTWSGAGITNSVTGTFDPSVAGAGAHVITYSLSCGSGTTTITVNACATLNICATGSVLAVSGGTPSYTWSTYNPGGTTPITTQAQCTACASGNTWLGGACFTSGFTPVTSCSTAPSWQQIATGTTYTSSGTFPIKVQDAASNTYTITSLGSVPTCTTICVTPTLSVNSATICAGASATLTISGATTYTWIPAATLSPNTGSVVVASPTTTITYTIGGTTATCSTTTIAQVTVNHPPDVSANGTNVCVGNTIHLNATGTAPSYVWNGPNTYSSNIQSPTISNATTASSGVYSVTTTGSNGCSVTHTTNVVVSPNPTVTVNSATICPGNSGTLTASGASTYTWSTTQTGNSIVVTPTVNTTYTVSGTDVNNCEDSTTTQVTINCSMGISQLSINNAVNIYPNPNNGNFIIDAQYKVQCIIYDVNGNVVLTQLVSGKTNIDAASLSEGVYNISIISNEGVVNKRLIIVK